MSRLKVKESLKVRKKMAKLIEITGKALSGEWGKDDETGNGVPVLRTTNFTNEGIIDYNSVVTRTITKKNIGEKFLRKGDIIIEKSGGSDKFPVGRVGDLRAELPDDRRIGGRFEKILSRSAERAGMER